MFWTVTFFQTSLKRTLKRCNQCDIFWVCKYSVRHPSYWYNSLQNYATLWWFLAHSLDAHENILSPAGLTVFVKSKTENQLIRFVIAYLVVSSRQQRKMWNSCCNARPHTSFLQTYGLLTVLTLILWITGYVECCSNVFIGNLLKIEGWWSELKRFLIEAWLGIQQSVGNWPMASSP